MPAKKILLVDDEEGILAIGELALGELGYETRTAVDGAQGWQALQLEEFDLLITDHNMPNLTGLELIRRVRAAHLEIPVMMVTGYLPLAEMHAAPELLPQTILEKPFTAKQLTHAVQVALGEAA